MSRWDIARSGIKEANRNSYFMLNGLRRRGIPEKLKSFTRACSIEVESQGNLMSKAEEAVDRSHIREGVPEWLICGLQLIYDTRGKVPLKILA